MPDYVIIDRKRREVISEPHDNFYQLDKALKSEFPARPAHEQARYIIGEITTNGICHVIRWRGEPFVAHNDVDEARVYKTLERTIRNSFQRGLIDRYDEQRYGSWLLANPYAAPTMVSDGIRASRYVSSLKSVILDGLGLSSIEGKRILGYGHIFAFTDRLATNLWRLKTPPFCL